MGDIMNGDTPKEQGNSTSPIFNMLIDATITLIKLVLRPYPRIGLALVVLTVIVLLTTIVSLGSLKDTGGILGAMGYFVLFLVGFSYLNWLFGPSKDAPKLNNKNEPTTTTTQRWIVGFFVVSLVAVSLLFATTLLALRSPGTALALNNLGFANFISPSCLLRPFSSCTDVLNYVDPVPPKPIPQTVAAPPPAQPTTVARDNFTVYIQYENLPRDWIKALAKELHDRGWKVPSYTLGGERIPAAAGLIEVRYGNDDDKAAARQLATEISAAGVTASPLTPKLVPIVKKGVLEVWISG